MNVIRKPTLLWLAVLAALLLSAGCDVITGASAVPVPGGGEGFAIYLTREDVPVSRMEALNHIEVAATPIIGPDDIQSYDWDAHHIRVTTETFERLINLAVPSEGRTFVACVDRQPVYWGMFWKSSGPLLVFPPAMIDLALLKPRGPAIVPILNVLSPDPRGSRLVRSALERDGKLAAFPEGFAVYLTRDDVPVSQMEALSHIEVAATPLIGPDDIILYDWRSHNIGLTPEAFGRIEALRPPTNGLACVDRQPVYWGAFWPMYSSQSFGGVVIPVAPTISAYNFGISIQLGYPGPDFWTDRDDPRDAPDIKAALAAAGKLN